MHTAALHRHHDARIKRRVATQYWNAGAAWCSRAYAQICATGRDGQTPRRIGIVARTKQGCSKSCCGNPRRHGGGPTTQERRALGLPP